MNLKFASIKAQILISRQGGRWRLAHVHEGRGREVLQERLREIRQGQFRHNRYKGRQRIRDPADQLSQRCSHSGRIELKTPFLPFFPPTQAHSATPPSPLIGALCLLGIHPINTVVPIANRGRRTHAIEVRAICPWITLLCQPQGKRIA